jgi:hypothetical protein
VTSDVRAGQFAVELADLLAFVTESTFPVAFRLLSSRTLVVCSAKGYRVGGADVVMQSGNQAIGRSGHRVIEIQAKLKANRKPNQWRKPEQRPHLPHKEGWGALKFFLVH